MKALTPSQQQAVTVTGNVLVMAGAGTGKTSTLIARCLRALIEERSSLDQILMVTFTEAAAAEMRQRLRQALRTRLEQPDLDPALREHLAEQIALLDTAFISTLHSFCLTLLRAHFHELALDPQFTVLDEQQTEPIIAQVFDEVFERNYASNHPEADAVRQFIRVYGRGSDRDIRAVVRRLHAYTQALPDPARWFTQQLALFNSPEPVAWRQWFELAVRDWCRQWQPVLANESDENPHKTSCVRLLTELSHAADPHKQWPAVLGELARLSQQWPYGTKGKFRKPLAEFFDGAEFLASLAPSRAPGAGDLPDPLAQDWQAVRHHMTALLRLTAEFTAAYLQAKREVGGLDFADLEQLTLRLLRDPSTGEATPAARLWRDRFHLICVDEYQDINAAQDAILTTLARDGAVGNRFLVGDVKQSIYRFRLADPAIFRAYQARWSQNTNGRCVGLTENFRSRSRILDFVNSLFALVMRREVGGLGYEPESFLKPGNPEPAPGLEQTCVEIHLLEPATAQAGPADVDDADSESESVPLEVVEREARTIAERLRALHARGLQVRDPETQTLRAVTWRDMAVLLRSLRGRADVYAREFYRAGVPLHAERGGFFEAHEVRDLVQLLRVLDNPLQDLPLLAVLCSPLVGMSPDELALLSGHDSTVRWWDRLGNVSKNRPDAQSWPPALLESARRKAQGFRAQCTRWREWVRHTSLSECLEAILQETQYEAVLRAGDRAEARLANVHRLLDLTRVYDPYQRQGLFRFLQFVEAQREHETDDAPALVDTSDAVRLLTIHKSKGLEFPVVVLAGLGTQFNTQDLKQSLLWDDHVGLAPKIIEPRHRAVYPSLPFWLARGRLAREGLGEELRLFYVGATRARDLLVLVGTSKCAGLLESLSPFDPRRVGKAQQMLTWLALWRVTQTSDAEGYCGPPQSPRAWRHMPTQPLSRPALATPASSDQTKIPDVDPQLVTFIEERLRWAYPHQVATEQPAKGSVTALRRRAESFDAESAPLFHLDIGAERAATDAEGLSAIEVGLAHHRFLQWVPLEAITSANLPAAAQELRDRQVLSATEFAALDLAALSAFFDSQLGRRVVTNRNAVRRELPFTARFTLAELQGFGLAAPGKTTDESVIVQGVVDLAVLLDRAIWVVDFKTDRIAAPAAQARAEVYGPQLKVYGAALARIYGRPVEQRWLHFLSPGTSVAV